MKEQLAKWIRIATVAPVGAAVLLTVLRAVQPGFYAAVWHYWYALGSLVLVPLLAYPVSWALRSSRARQRKLAVLFSLAGYFLLLVLCIAAPVSGAECAVYLTYMLSVLVVALTSRFPKLRASGHACGVSGPLTVLIYLHGLRWLAPGLAVLAAVFWSSITLGRHTLRQLLLGAAAPAVIFLAFAAVGMV